MMHLEPES